MHPSPKQGNGNPPDAGSPGQLHYRAKFLPVEDEAARRYVLGTLSEALDRLWDIERLGRPFTSITPEAFRIWHKGLFSGVVDDVLIGRFREHGEHSTYQLWETQADGPMQRRRVFGVRARKNALNIQREIKAACQEFQASLPSRITTSTTVADMVAGPAKLYVETLRIRPFRQGNDAVAYVALHAAYHRSALDAPAFTPRGSSEVGVEFNQCIALALHSRSPDLQPLLDFLARNSHFA